MKSSVNASWCQDKNRRKSKDTRHTVLHEWTGQHLLKRLVAQCDTASHKIAQKVPEQVLGRDKRLLLAGELKIVAPFVIRTHAAKHEEHARVAKSIEQVHHAGLHAIHDHANCAQGSEMRSRNKAQGSGITLTAPLFRSPRHAPSSLRACGDAWSRSRPQRRATSSRSASRAGAQPCHTCRTRPGECGGGSRSGRIACTRVAWCLRAVWMSSLLSVEHICSRTYLYCNTNWGVSIPTKILTSGLR